MAEMDYGLQAMQAQNAAAAARAAEARMNAERGLYSDLVAEVAPDEEDEELEELFGVTLDASETEEVPVADEPAPMADPAAEAAADQPAEDQSAEATGDTAEAENGQ